MISTARSFTNQPGHSLTWPLKMLCCNSLGSSEGLGHELPLLLAWPYNKPFSAPNSDISASVTSLCVRHMDSHLVTKSQIRHWLMNLRIYDFVFLKISFLQTKIVCKISVQFSSSVMFDSLQPHGLQNARPPCSSPTPGAYSNSCPLSPIISSSAVAFSSCLQSFSASGSFPVSQFFTSGGQSIGISASASIQRIFRTDFL